jgi:hypothetical protein
MYKAVFEKDTLDNFYADSIDGAVEIVTEYIGSHNDMIASLTKANQDGIEALCSAVHFHSSVFMYVGFPQLSLDCLDFEKKILNKDAKEVTTLFNNLIECIDETIIILKTELIHLTNNYTNATI